MYAFDMVSYILAGLRDWCMWNAYMNFVAYCHLFTCICILYDVITMYLDVFGDFPTDPLYFGYNSAGQETPVLCIFFVSGTYTDSNWPRIFRRSLFSKIWRYEALESSKRSWEEGKSRGGALTPLGAPPVLLAASGLHNRPSKAPEGSLDLKTPYIKASDASHEGGDA